MSVAESLSSGMGGGGISFYYYFLYILIDRKKQGFPTSVVHLQLNHYKILPLICTVGEEFLIQP